MTDKILSESADGIGWLTFNNPERRNAVSLEMWQAITDVIAGFEADPAVRVVVLRGAGGKAFMSGADISQFEGQRNTAEQAEAYARISEAGKRSLEAFSKPLVAMIEGFCMGGGVGVALSADIRIATDSAVFGIPAARLGLGYPFESVVKLVNVVGPAAAKRLLLTAQRIPAAEALRIGLVTQLVPAAELEATVREVAEAIAANAPLTVRAAKLAIDQVVMDPGDRDLDRVEAAVRACFESEDYVTGRRAFTAKETPVFTGR